MDEEKAKQRIEQIIDALRARRKRLGLSQEDVAQKLDMQRSSISNLERTRTPRSVTLLRYADAIDARLVPVGKEFLE